MPMLLVVLQVRYAVNQAFMPSRSAVVQPGAPVSRIRSPSITWVSAWDISRTPSLRPVVVQGTTWPKVMFGFIFVAELRNQVRMSSSARLAYAALPVYHHARVSFSMACHVFAHGVRSPVVATVGPHRPSLWMYGQPSLVFGFGQ